MAKIFFSLFCIGLQRQHGQAPQGPQNSRDGVGKVTLKPAPNVGSL